MSGYLAQAGFLILGVVLLALSTLFVLRFLLQWMNVDYQNPFSQVVVYLSNPLLRVPRKLLPRSKHLDTASLLMACLVQGIKLCLFAALIHKQLPTLVSVAVLAVAHTIQIALHIFSFTIIAVVLISWLNPYTFHPAKYLLQQMSRPLLQAIRRHLPPIGGLDLAPLVALLLLQLLAILVVAPLLDLGSRISALPIPPPVVH